MTSKIFKWEKAGHLYSVSGESQLMTSHAQVPVAELIDNERIRIYYSSRDSSNRSRIYSMEISSKPPYKVILINKNPILDLGPLGSFDDCGVMPTWVIDVGNDKYLYYIGWNTRKDIPYHNSIGLAISKDGGQTFSKAFAGPILDRNTNEPYFAGTACVIYENGIWKNWYLSCTGWAQGAQVPEPLYHLKYAESLDGINWNRKGIVAIDYKNPEEGGIVKASVVHFEDGYSMWYAYRNKFDFRENTSNSYKIGYAQSEDGIHWSRMDEISGIENSKDGWDSQMTAYPHVIPVNNQLLMFYNGNGFGASGFGVAVAENKYRLYGAR